MIINVIFLIGCIILATYFLFKWGFDFSKEGIIFWYNNPITKERKWWKF